MKPCATGRIRNPRSNRCVLQKGKIGRLLRVVKNNTKRPVREVNNSQSETKVKQALVKLGPAKVMALVEKAGYVIISVLGKGAFGVVFLAQKKSDRHEHSVFKIVKEKLGDAMGTLLEKQMQELFAAHALGVPVSRVEKYTYNGATFSVLQMNKIDGLMRERLMKVDIEDKVALNNFTDSILTLVVKMAQVNVTHGDMHDENTAYIACLGYYAPVLIDFGYSMVGNRLPEVDIIQYIRGLMIDPKTFKYPSVKYVAGQLLEAYNRITGKKIKLQFNLIDKEHARLFYDVYIPQQEAFQHRMKLDYERTGRFPVLDNMIRDAYRMKKQLFTREECNLADTADHDDEDFIPGDEEAEVDDDDWRNDPFFTG